MLGFIIFLCLLGALAFLATGKFLVCLVSFFVWSINIDKLIRQNKIRYIYSYQHLKSRLHTSPLRNINQILPCSLLLLPLQHRILSPLISNQLHQFKPLLQLQNKHSPHQSSHNNKNNTSKHYQSNLQPTQNKLILRTKNNSCRTCTNRIICCNNNRLSIKRLNFLTFLTKL